MSERSVVLRRVSEPGNSRTLTATLAENGDLVIEGQDLGDEVERIFGMREYEWIWTVRARDLPRLLDALGATSGLLAAMKARFSGDRAADLMRFLDDHAIPYETWSRMGD